MSDYTQLPPPARHTVLLVDDDARVRYTLTLLLRWSGAWQVIGEAEDGATALDLAGTRDPDLVLLDLWLPDGDGLSLLPRLRALHPPPLVVLLTAEPADGMRERALVLGAAAYLAKTMPPDELLAALQTLFDRGGIAR
jgi:DNA-binding NarL/FixJ family response regulator